MVISLGILTQHFQTNPNDDGLLASEFGILNPRELVSLKSFMDGKILDLPETSGNSLETLWKYGFTVPN